MYILKLVRSARICLQAVSSLRLKAAAYILQFLLSALSCLQLNAFAFSLDLLTSSKQLTS